MSKQVYKELISSKMRIAFQDYIVRKEGSAEAVVNNKEVHDLYLYIDKLLSEKQKEEVQKIY